MTRTFQWRMYIVVGVIAVLIWHIFANQENPSKSPSISNQPSSTASVEVCNNSTVTIRGMECGKRVIVCRMADNKRVYQILPIDTRKFKRELHGCG